MILDFGNFLRSISNFLRPGCFPIPYCCVVFGQTVALEDWGGGSVSCPHPVDGYPTDVMFWPDAAGNAVYLVSRAGVGVRQ